MDTEKKPGLSSVSSLSLASIEAQRQSGPSAADAKTATEIEYPSLLLVLLLNFALLLSNFLVALDINIISTALPTITTEFHSVSQVGWYGSSFFMGLVAFSAFWGKAYKYFPLKSTFLACITVFELGSLVAGLAPNSATVILGRAIQGVGAAGVSSGTYTICAFINTPTKVPLVSAFFAVAWTVASVAGPVIGGVFTSYATWRWCFYANLPIGAVVFLIIGCSFRTPNHSRMAAPSWKSIVKQFDVFGVVILLAALVCLVLALEKGGLSLSWNSAQVRSLLVGFGTLAISFAVWEWRQGEDAMIVPRIISRRSILVLGLFSFASQSAGFARNYNLPIYFQAAQGVPAAESGVRTLPTVLAVSIFSFIASASVGKVGCYMPFLVLGGIFLTVGAGLIYTFTPSSPAHEYIGYQVIAGIGTGLTIQMNVVVGQLLSSHADMAVTVAIALFWQSLGGTIGVSAAQSIQNNILVKSLPIDNARVTKAAVLAAGAGDLRRMFPNPEDLRIVVSAYMDGLRGAWVWSIALSGLALLVAFGSERMNVRAEKVEKGRKQQSREAV